MANAPPNTIDLDALLVLIDCMTTTPRLLDDEVSALHRPYSRQIISEMLKTGKTGAIPPAALSLSCRNQKPNYS